MKTAAFNRWMRKTARPVVWEGAGAQSPAPDPIGAVGLNLSAAMKRMVGGGPKSTRKDSRHGGTMDFGAKW